MKKHYLVILSVSVIMGILSALIIFFTNTESLNIGDFIMAHDYDVTESVVLMLQSIWISISIVSFISYFIVSYLLTRKYKGLASRWVIWGIMAIFVIATQALKMAIFGLSAYGIFFIIYCVLASLMGCLFYKVKIYYKIAIIIFTVINFAHFMNLTGVGRAMDAIDATGIGRIDESAINPSEEKSHVELHLRDGEDSSVTFSPVNKKPVILFFWENEIGSRSELARFVKFYDGFEDKENRSFYAIYCHKEYEMSRIESVNFEEDLELVNEEERNISVMYAREQSMYISGIGLTILPQVIIYDSKGNILLRNSVNKAKEYLQLNSPNY